MLALTLVLLLPQVGTAPDTTSGSGSVKVIGSLPAPLIAAEISAPQELVGQLLDSRFKHKLMESDLWSTLQSLPQYPMVEVGWQTFLSPALGDAKLFFSAIAGDGALFLMTAKSAPGEFDLTVLLNGHDGELAQDCLAPLLGMAGIARNQIAEESWQVSLEALTLLRSEDRFAFGTNAALLKRYLDTPLAQLRKQSIPPDCRSAADRRGAQAFAWINGDLLRANGYPERPEDAVASYLLGDAHEVLRTAAWLGGSLRIESGHVMGELFAPANDKITESHAPFFPAPYQIPMPLIDSVVLHGIFTRDLGQWWTARHLYMQERAVVESVEGDGVMALLFGRDPGSEVFAWLQSDMRLIAATLPEAERAGLPIEYPTGAVGFRMKEDAPADLKDSFVNAFMAAITFANFEDGGMGKESLLMKVEEIEQGSLYSSSYRRPPEGKPLSAAHNVSPSMLIAKDGAIWISSSLSLLKEIAVAPTESVIAHGMWLDLEMPQLLTIMERDRNILVANRLLEEGGDIAAANTFVDMMMSALAIFDTVSISSRLDEGLMSMQFGIQAAP